ncbi:DUF262 domain-containing protein [Thermoanaerobacteraceae bacterium SP2]|nr:DUF262 domain-containing protein [Thermoanaerobacteraceae bacterium SP2]
MNQETLEREILETRNSLSTDRLDMSFGEIMSMYEREEIIIDPDFQRLFRWSNYQQTRFIESLLLGIPIPPIFVAEDKNGKWELVDGLQRLSTVLSFFGILKSYPEKNNWVLCKGDLIESLEGYDYKSLPLKFQLNIKRSVCRIEIIKWNSKIDMRYELFNRLNTGGSPLTDQEIRNCIFRGISSRFNDFLKRVAQREDFIELIGPTDKQISELYLEELVLRFVSLYNSGDNVKEILSVHLTEYMRDVVKNNNFDYSIENLIIRIINVLKPLGKDVFRFNKGVFSTSLYDAITIGVAMNIESYEKLGSKFLLERIEKLKENVDFRKYTGSAANSKTRVINRIKIAKDIFKVE